MTMKPGTKKRYHIELTRLSITLWSIFFLVLLSWSFFLGILLGQGFLPGAGTAISDLSRQISRVQDMVKAKEPLESRPTIKAEPDPKLDFYERLATKKDEAKRESEVTPKSQSPQVVEGTEKNPVVRPPPAVKKEIPVVVHPEVEKTRPTSVDIPYTVQVASLENEESASDLASRLIRKGYSAYYYSVTMSGKTLYRVRCGRFHTREDADNYVRKLEQEAGIKGFVSRIE
ncbi:MAG: SPOR domain-containing protein [Deltaproteobacteria bacterium]|nr:SPOR domain-containing protein [Deltaproteobacteria bacterium]